MTVQIHETQFHRNTRTGDWRAVCSCGWFLIGDRDRVQARAATHDLEWQPADPSVWEPAAVAP